MMSVSVPTNLLPPLAFIDGLGGPEMLLVLVIVLLLFGGEGAMGWRFCGLQGAWGCGDQQEQEG